MADIKSQREAISKELETEGYTQQKVRVGSRYVFRNVPTAKREELEKELTRLNELEKSISGTYSHWERAAATREERKEQRAFDVEQKRAGKENLQSLRERAARAGEGTREEIAYLQAREDYRKQYGSVQEFKPITYTGTATAFTKGTEERKTVVTEGIPFDVPKSAKVTPGFLEGFGIEPAGPREDFIIERQKRFEEQKEQFALGVASYQREFLFAKQAAVSDREYILKLESVTPGFKSTKFVKAASIAKRDYDIESDFYSRVTAKQPSIDYLGVNKFIESAAIEFEKNKLESLSGFEKRVESLSDWEKSLNVRAIESRKNLGLDVLNYTGQESNVAKILKGYGNIGYYASGLGTAEFLERTALYGGKAAATVEGLFRTPSLTKAEISRARKEASKVYDIRTPTGLVTWTTAIVAPVGSLLYQRYSKPGQARAVLKQIKPEDTRITQYYGAKEISFGMKSDIKVNAFGKTWNQRGPVTQEYNIVAAGRGPAVASSKSMFGVITKKGYQYSTTKVNLYGKQYYVRSRITPLGDITSKVFRGDVLLKTFTGKSQPGVVFTEPKKVIVKKEFVEEYGGLKEYRIEQLSGLKSVKGVQARVVKTKPLSYSEYYPTGKGVIRSQEVLGVESVRLRSESVAMKPFEYNFATGKVKPAGLIVKYGATKYKFVKDFSRPKPIEISETVYSRASNIPALSRTTQRSSLRGIYEISYSKKQPEVFSVIKKFGDMKIWQSKRATYKLSGVTTTKLLQPKPAITQTEGSLTFFKPTTMIKTPSLAVLAPVIQPEVSSKDVLRGRTVSEPISKISPITQQLPITSDVFKLEDIPILKEQPLSSVIPQTIGETRTAPLTKQSLVQVPLTKQSLVQVPIGGFSGLDIPRPEIPEVPGIETSLFLPGIEPEKKSKKKSEESYNPFDPRYIASVEATLFNIRGKLPKDYFTGLNTRPLIGG